MKQNTIILFREMQYSLKIGITKEEQKQEQPIFFDIDIALDISEAAKKQTLQETIDYVEVQKSIETFLNRKEYALLEAVANDVGEMLLHEFSKIEKVQLTCWKPRALAKKKVKNVGIQIIKTRE